MAKNVVNSDIYNIAKLVNDVKSIFIPNETEDTLALSTYGYIGALESNRLQTQVQMTGELCNEVFPSRARLERNVITHAITTNIENINAIPAKMTIFLAIRENDIQPYFDSDTNIFTIDRECPIQIGKCIFHLEYDIKLKKIKVATSQSAVNINDSGYAYTAQYDITNDHPVPTSEITVSDQYLNPPAIVNVNNENYLYLTCIVSQVEHVTTSTKMISSNALDNKILNFSFSNQLAYFEIHCTDQSDEYYITPVFEGSAVPDNSSSYYCWYQYIDTNSIRVRFDRKSYIPPLNAVVECLIKTTQGDTGNYTYTADSYITLESTKYNYQGITCLVTPVTSSSGGKDRKSKEELQGLIPKEILSRGSITTISDLNNYFNMINSDIGKILIQKKIDNQIERVYYAYLVTKDTNNNVIPSNTLDLKIGLDNLIDSKVYSTETPKYILPAGTCFRLGGDGIAYVNDSPLLYTILQFTPDSVSRTEMIHDEFIVEVVNTEPDSVSCSVAVGDCETDVHVFPTLTEDGRLIMSETSTVTEVEDYIQMGVGQKYKYTATYLTKEDNTLIQANDNNLDCFDLLEATCTVNGEEKSFSALPMAVYGIPKNTKVHFEILYRLNTKHYGLIYLELNNKVYEYIPDPNKTQKLSEALKYFGLVGEVTNAVSSDESYLKLAENGTIIPPTPTEKDYQLIIATEKSLPDVNDRYENQWFYVIEKASYQDSPNVELRTIQIDNSNNPYHLSVVTENNLPLVENRNENDWFYVVDPSESSISEDYTEYHLDVEKEEDMPPIGERDKTHWWYSMYKQQERGEVPDPPVEVLSGKEYDIIKVDNFEGNTVQFLVTIDGTIYTIRATQDRHIIKNGITITDNSVESKDAVYRTYVPTLDQDTWPTSLVKGTRVKYTLEYKSISNTYKPTISIKLSKGLQYVSYTNWVTYPDGSMVQLEPTEVEVRDKTKFLYTNPYAIIINGKTLYSAFYMMAINESPYLYFDYVNDKSNAQFITSNIYWNRPFVGSNIDQYTLVCRIVQSAQMDLGISGVSSSSISSKSFTPLVKVFAVFKKDGSPYRYRSMNLNYFDASSYSYEFTQSFTSKDIFDQNNYIKMTNVQIAGQKEYTVELKYQNAEYVTTTMTLQPGEIISLDTLREELEMDTTKIVSEVLSTNKTVLDVYQTSTTPLEYEVRSFTDFSGSVILVLQYSDGTSDSVVAYSYGPDSYTVSIGDTFTKKINIKDAIYATDILSHYEIEYETLKDVSFNTITKYIQITPLSNDEGVVTNFKIDILGDFVSYPGVLTISYDNEIVNYYMTSSGSSEYGFFAPNTELKLYVAVSLPDIEGVYSKYDLSSIVPGMEKWTVTNVYGVVNGVNMYHNYSEIMGSRCIPYGDHTTGNTLELKGYYVKGVPMLGYDYCQDNTLAQNAIEALNSRKAYIDNALEVLENSFGIDFKLFNTYGPSNIYYIIRDTNGDNSLNDEAEFIDSVNLTFYFRIKLVSNSDSYTKDNIISEIKSYVENLNEISELHIPNLVTQINTNYSEQVSYFEYLGFNDYGPEVQHIYRVSDNEIPIHTGPEFLNVSNILHKDGTVSPDINIYISEM